MGFYFHLPEPMTVLKGNPARCESNIDYNELDWAGSELCGVVVFAKGSQAGSGGGTVFPPQLAERQAGHDSD